MTTWGTTENNTKIGINSWWEKLNDTTARLYQQLRFSTTSSVTDSTNTLYWSGHLSGTQSPGVAISTYTGEFVMRTLTSDHTIPTGSGLSKSLDIALYPIEYVGDDRLDASETATFSGYPNAVTGQTATRVNDGQINLAWTRNSTGGAPYEQISIYRYDNVSDAWPNIAVIDGSATSYADTTVVANRSWIYDIYVWNSTGSSPYARTSTVYTTPNVPTNVTAAKVGTTVNLSWINNSSIQTAVEVWHGTVTGGVTTWDGTALATLGAAATTYSHTGANPAQIHVYRVRGTVSGLGSAWAVSNTVQLQAPPLAPSVSASQSVIDFALTDLTMSWVHNSVDSSAQTAAQMQYREVATPTWTTVTVTTASAYTILKTVLANPKQYEFQVRTKGDHANYGPWSASVLVQGSATPTASLSATLVAGKYQKSELTVALAYFDAESTAMANSIVTLKQAGTALESKTGTATTITFTTKLANATTYTVEARAQDGSGLWSSIATLSIVTEFLNPPKPVVAATFNQDQGYVSLSVTTPNPLAGEVGADHVEIQRYTDGAWVTLAANALPNGSLTDRIPPLCAQVAYRAVAVSSTPSTTNGDAVYVATDTPWVFLNGGSGFGTMARLKSGAKVDRVIGRAKVLHTFAGQEDATEFIGTARVNEFKVSANVGGYANSAEHGEYTAFETVADLPAPICYRDPMGRRIFSSISDVDISHATTTKFAQVSFLLKKVGYSE